MRRRLFHLDRKLADASPLVRGDGLPRWTPSRFNAVYIPALRMAELVLQNMVAEAAVGKLRVASFVVNMAKVFEDFVTVAMMEALRKYPGKTVGQYPTHLDEPRSDGVARIVLRPDIVHLVNRESALIFDAKYKAASSKGQYPNADHYQMLAYTTAMGQPHGWLVYAGQGRRIKRTIQSSGISVFEVPLDISRNPEKILNEIDQLASQSVRFSGFEATARTLGTVM